MQVLVSCIVAIALALTGCAGRRTSPDDASQPRFGTADLEILPPPPSQPPPEGYEPKVRPPESAPVVRRQGLPRYPESALQSEVTCTARLLYHIQTDGSATLVLLEWDVPPPDEHLKAFEKAIKEAVGGWEFTPARRYVSTKMPDTSIRLVPKTIPKAGRALIRFRVEKGRAVVE